MTGDQRDVDVAALADGLAVVHGFKDGEAARVLLHQTGEGVEIAGALVATQCLPRREGSARGFDGGVHVIDVAESDFGEGFAGGGVGVV